VGLILDVAVVALALIIIGSLGLLAWTLGISAVRATRLGRRRVAVWGRSATAAEAWLQTNAADTSATLADLAARTNPANLVNVARPAEPPRSATPATPAHAPKPGD